MLAWKSHPAIRQAIAEGININVTLLFSVDRYQAVAEAYIAGLEDRLAAGHPIDQLASVASFFISRIDTLVKPLLIERGLAQPMDTVNAYRDAGQPAVRLSSHYAEALKVLEQVQQAGIDLNAVAEQLEKEEITKFNQPYDKLLEAIDTQKRALTVG